MDITLLRTFLEVAATGSFVSAAERLFVTQSAVSLRIRRLEDSLGKPLFLRSKAGATLTPAGEAFERYALSLVKIWEEARQQIAVPQGFTASLSIGAQYSLWPRLGFPWLDALRKTLPQVSLRSEIGMPDRLTRFLVEGMTQMALLYTPQARPGLALERVVEEDLVMVAAWPGATLEDLSGRYVFVDWGPEFVHAHAINLPKLTSPGLTMALGSLAARYLIGRGLAGYLPARAVKEHLETGALHLVANAPMFPYPAWLVWREDLDPAIAAPALAALRNIAASRDREQGRLIRSLARLSDGDTVALLGGG